MLKRLFKRYKQGNTYWVNINDIVINPRFSQSKPRYSKLKSKRDYYIKTGEFESQIKLMNNFTLIDGYTSFLIGEEMGLKKLPVHFEK